MIKKQLWSFHLFCTDWPQ